MTAVKKILNALSLLCSLSGEGLSASVLAQVREAEESAAGLECGAGACHDLSCDFREGHTGLHEDPVGRQWGRWELNRGLSLPWAHCRCCDHRTRSEDERVPLACERCASTKISIRWYS